MAILRSRRDPSRSRKQSAFLFVSRRSQDIVRALLEKAAKCRVVLCPRYKLFLNSGKTPATAVKDYESPFM